MRHGKPYLLKDGQPMNADEALFIRQKAGSSTAVGQPLLGMRTLPLVAGNHEKQQEQRQQGGSSNEEHFTVYDRLSEVSTASRLLCKTYFAEDRAAAEKVRTRRPQSQRSKYVPL